MADFDFKNMSHSRSWVWPVVYQLHYKQRIFNPTRKNVEYGGTISCHCLTLILQVLQIQTSQKKFDKGLRKPRTCLENVISLIKIGVNLFWLVVLSLVNVHICKT